MNLDSVSLSRLPELLSRVPSILIEKLRDSAKACLLKVFQEKLQKHIVVITSDTRANKLLDNCPFFNIQNVFELLAWETLPGEEIPPSADIVGKRFETLYQLFQTSSPTVVICSLQAALQRVPSSSFLSKHCVTWRIGDEKPFSSLQEHLQNLGYRRSSIVMDKGEFALRGGIVDLFPVNAPQPYRVEFFSDTIDSIRSFDPIGQKSVQKIQQFLITPAKEKELLEQECLSSTIFSYLGHEPLIIFDDLLSLEDRLVALQKLPGMKSKTMISFSHLLKEIASSKIILWSEQSIEELSEVRIKEKKGRGFYAGKEELHVLEFECFNHLFKTHRWSSCFRPLSDDLLIQKETQLHLIYEHENEKQQLISHFPRHPHLSFVTGYLSDGLAFKDSETVFFPITELTHRPKVRRQSWRHSYHTPPSDFHELMPGDLVVHFHQGIGKYMGVETKPNHQGVATEFLVIEYAEQSKLYVPLSQAYLVSRYIGTHEEIPTLHTLGTKNWQRAKTSAQQAIVGYAQKLLQLHAEREIEGGFIYPEDSEDMIRFESEFPYQETEDQLKAIFEIKQDMMSKKAMDRLLCGDVGYGKTEVAMRAAFKAAVDGKKQVAVLVPTTVLALQHYETFTNRMQGHALNVKAVSRFQSSKEVKQTIEDVKNGKVDILIGTHRLLSKDIQFKDLGLIIIDEEQRFGVRAKEHLKMLKKGVDCLTLTATPIPRTLYLSLVGARDVSVINTPPHDRLPIKTILAERDPYVIENALLRELSRDGQAYFIHNRVESIGLVSQEISKMLPQARIVTGHGQMNADEIDSVFYAFKSGQADILVATTIVENGIDISNANTILIDRADQFGLSDLYQLRGRVGRGGRPAYAYFLIPRLKELPEVARKRLYALLETQGFGGGMKIAMRDLEIRGGGEILGERQSGEISSIGFHLYCKLLKRAVAALKSKQDPAFFETKMEFTFDARLPKEYIPETSLCLELYHRLGETLTCEEVDDIFKEIEDRFGQLPPQALWLYHLTRLRTIAAQKRYTLLKIGNYFVEAEQLVAKGSIKKNFPIKPSSSPAALEKQIALLL